MNLEDYITGYEEQVDISLDLFMNNYQQYMKIKLIKPTTKDIEELYTQSSQLNLIIEDVYSKIEAAKKAINESRFKSQYSSNLKNIEIKKDTLDRLVKKFKERYQSNSDFLIEYQDNLEEKEKVKSSGNNNKENTITTQNSNTSETNNDDDFEDMKQEDLVEGIDQLLVVKEIVDNDENFLGCSKEEMEQIIQIKNDLKDLLAMTREQIESDNQKLIEIEENVEKSAAYVEKGIKELKKAALINNSKNKLKYQLLFGSVFGILGTALNVIPGLGNALGAFLGAKVGKLMSKIDKKAIDKIEKKYNKKKKKK